MALKMLEIRSGIKNATLKEFKPDMNRPLIGIPIYPPVGDDRYTLPEGYVTGVRRAGGQVTLLPPGEDHPESWTDMLDGLILAGGGDVDPSHYMDNHDDSLASSPPERVDHQRDRTEIAVLTRALQREIPILAICRGLQLLNVHLGGTLHLHIPDHFGDDVAHGVPAHNFSSHTVELVKDSQLSSKIGSTHLEVMSSHHQGVHQVAPSLSVAGHASDGCIEALDMEEYRWLAAVQWHPEEVADVDPLQQSLFDQLVQASRN